MKLNPQHLNITFLSPWPEAGGDLYQDNLTGTSFVVQPGDKIETVIAEVQARFKEGE